MKKTVWANSCYSKCKDTGLAGTPACAGYLAGCRFWSQNSSTFILISSRAKIPKYRQNIKIRMHFNMFNFLQVLEKILCRLRLKNNLAVNVIVYCSGQFLIFLFCAILLVEEKASPGFAHRYSANVDGPTSQALCVSEEECRDLCTSTQTCFGIDMCALLFGIYIAAAYRQCRYFLFVVDEVSNLPASPSKLQLGRYDIIFT